MKSSSLFKLHNIERFINRILNLINCYLLWTKKVRFFSKINYHRRDRLDCEARFRLMTSLGGTR
jgi:hypothetical protein